MTLPSATSFGQKGKIKFVVIPSDEYYFILDGKERFKTNVVELEPGRHTFKFWAPMREIMDTAFTIKSDTLIVRYLKIPYTQQFAKYREQMDLIEMRRKWMRLPTTVFAVGNLFYTSAKWAQVHRKHTELMDRYENYPSLTEPALVSDSKSRMLTLKDELARNKTQLFVSAGTLAASTAISYWLIRKAANIEEPNYEDKNKVIFDGLTWHGQNQQGVSLAFRYKF